MALSETQERLARAESALTNIGKSSESAWDLLEAVGELESSFGPVLALKKESGLAGDELERLLVRTASQRALSRVAALPVEQSVRERLARDLETLHAMTAPMEAGSYNFNRASKLATLRRFPAGPMEWEISAIPRSFFLQASFPANLKMAAFVATKLGGLGPCFFMHVAPAPRNRAFSIPKEVLRSYYRMARSIETQPEMRAILAHAWFHDPRAVRDTPTLEVINEPYVSHGGLITLLGPAPASSGVLEGNAQRREAYLAGTLRYRYGFAIWPREAAIRWAQANPGLA